MKTKEKQWNKVRNMKGSRPGGGSAGRANGSHVEKRLTAAGPVMTGFIDVNRACTRWLMERDPEYRKQREYIEQQQAERQERRRSEQ